jgi:hypothetical protein
MIGARRLTGGCDVRFSTVCDECRVSAFHPISVIPYAIGEARILPVS